MECKCKIKVKLRDFHRLRFNSIVKSERRRKISSILLFMPAYFFTLYLQVASPLNACFDRCIKSIMRNKLILSTLKRDKFDISHRNETKLEMKEEERKIEKLTLSASTDSFTIYLITLYYTFFSSLIHDYE